MFEYIEMAGVIGLIALFVGLLLFAFKYKVKPVSKIELIELFKDNVILDVELSFVRTGLDPIRNEKISYYEGTFFGCEICLELLDSAVLYLFPDKFKITEEFIRNGYYNAIYLNTGNVWHFSTYWSKK